MASPRTGHFPGESAASTLCRRRADRRARPAGRSPTTDRPVELPSPRSPRTPPQRRGRKPSTEPTRRGGEGRAIRCGTTTPTSTIVFAAKPSANPEAPSPGTSRTNTAITATASICRKVNTRTLHVVRPMQVVVERPVDPRRPDPIEQEDEPADARPRGMRREPLRELCDRQDHEDQVEEELQEGHPTVRRSVGESGRWAPEAPGGARPLWLSSHVHRRGRSRDRLGPRPPQCLGVVRLTRTRTGS